MISTHALREEGDIDRIVLRYNYAAFLPTPSARRATRPPLFYLREFRISTHALREEGDDKRVSTETVKAEFLPTPSARRATGQLPRACPLLLAISTHALREEGDKD